MSSNGKSEVSAPAKAPALPGFTRLSDQLFVREGSSSSRVTVTNDNGDDEKTEAETSRAPDASHPDVVLIFGWGDASPRHVAKFADGFRTLYPDARQIVVLSPIMKVMFARLEQRSEMMKPLVETIFPNGPDAADAPRRILTHAMSNTGAVYYASMLHQFRQLYGKPFPHDLFCMDSTPGSTDLDWSNTVRWSRAMALGPAKMFPWPFVVTQSLMAVVLVFNYAVQAVVVRQDSPGGWSRKAANNPEYESKDAHRLYMYSKEDDLIGHDAIEEHAAESRDLGWEADVEVFKDSGHVGHMKMHGEQYWKAVDEAWQKTTKAA